MANINRPTIVSLCVLNGITMKHFVFHPTVTAFQQAVLEGVKFFIELGQVFINEFVKAVKPCLRVNRLRRLLIAHVNGFLKEAFHRL